MVEVFWACHSSGPLKDLRCWRLPGSISCVLLGLGGGPSSPLPTTRPTHPQPPSPTPLLSAPPSPSPPDQPPSKNGSSQARGIVDTLQTRPTALPALDHFIHVPGIRSGL